MTLENQLPPQEILEFYEQSYEEKKRLMTGASRLEFLRTKEILERHLPAPPAIIYDIGGGPGVYACWLAKKGYQVHLIDPVSLHVEQAKEASASQPQFPITSIRIGDARNLDIADQSADAVLMLGPLYHLTEKFERIAALRESLRILKLGGKLFAAVISRFASALDGMISNVLGDSGFFQIVKDDLLDGKHHNSEKNPAYFTTAFFHRPDQIKTEIEEAGLNHEKTLAIEGPVWLLQNFEEQWSDQCKQERLLDIIRKMEEESSLLGASAHIMAIAHK